MSVMREGRLRKLHEKLTQRDGMILPIVLLSIAVIASTILFVVIPGYQEHLRKNSGRCTERCDGQGCCIHHLSSGWRRFAHYLLL